MLNLSTTIMIRGKVTRYLFQRITRHITSRLEINSTNLTLTKTPNILQKIRDIKLVTVRRQFIKFFIRKIVIKDKSMIMGTRSCVSIFATTKKTDSTVSNTITKPL